MSNTCSDLPWFYLAGEHSGISKQGLRASLRAEAAVPAGLSSGLAASCCAAHWERSILLKLNAIPATHCGMRCGVGRLHKSKEGSRARDQRIIGDSLHPCPNAGQSDGAQVSLPGKTKARDAGWTNTVSVRTAWPLPVTMIRPSNTKVHNTSAPRDTAQVVGRDGRGGFSAHYCGFPWRREQGKTPRTRCCQPSRMPLPALYSATGCAQL